MSLSPMIYDRLRAAGVTHAGALGLLGNWQAESGLEPSRLQNDFSPQRSLSRAYTADVTAGKIPRAQFARDQKGYGLAQWTYFNFTTGQGRKLALYDFWKQSGKALDDASMQVAFALHELQTEAQYAGLWQLLQTTDDLYTAVDKVCRLYEQPYYLNIDTRFRCARELEAELNKIRAESDTAARDPTCGEPGLPDGSDVFWPPRTVDRSMSGKDVRALQAVLDARGYAAEADGTVGDLTDRAIRAFQKDHSLAVDGVCGPKTWKELLKL